MYEDYEEIDDESIQRNKLKIFNILIPLLILAIIVVVILLLLSNNNSSGNSYDQYEKKMVDTAKKYVKKHNVSSTNEVYLDLLKLEMDPLENCSNTSGVIYDGEEYTPYLSCSDYESKIVNNQNSNISLLGDEVIVLIKGSEYIEPGYISNLDVIVSGEVGKEEGVYDIYYLTSAGNVSRKVIVINNPLLLANIPRMELIGNSSEIVDIDSEFTDPGVKVVDNSDTNILSKVVKNSNINTSSVGIYNVVYSVKNSLGYKNYITRKVMIIDKKATLNVITDLSPKSLVRDSVEIILNVYGNDYLHTILPNGKQEKNSIIQYRVTENGTYEFIVIDKLGNTINKQVEVNNIRRDIPNATCTATIKNDGTSVSVQGEEKDVVLSYNYVIDNVESGYKVVKDYKSTNSSPSKVLIKLRDSVGNENTITCKMVDERKTFNPNGYTKTIETSSRIKEALPTALSKKGYSIYDLNACIYNRVMEAGPGTRYGVVAAGYGLIDCTYSMLGAVLPYNHEGGKVEGNYCAVNSEICGKLGVSSKWGSKGGVCGRDANGNVREDCRLGLNCATFVGWALCNGGMDMCTKRSAGAYSMASTTYFPEADGVIITGNNVKYFSGNNLTGYGAATLVRMIKPGDVIARIRVNDNDGSSQHVFLVVGMDDTGIYTANDGYYVNKISYSYMLKGEMTFRILYLDNYYANAANKNHLYPE